MACRAPKSDSTNSLTRLEELELLSNGLPHRKRRARPQSPAPWSKAYVNLCMLGALMAGCAPLAVVLTHMSVVFLATDDDGAPGGGACPVDRGDLATNGTMLVRGAGHVALVTLSDEGPRGETRRLTRLALANKRAYASAHNYSLVVFDAPRAECARRVAKLLALQVTGSATATTSTHHTRQRLTSSSSRCRRSAASAPTSGCCGWTPTLSLWKSPSACPPSSPPPSMSAARRRRRRSAAAR